MEASVYTYFFAIGAGLATGIAAVVLPAYWIITKMSKGGKKNVF